jgi:hypothetical protein
VVLGATFESVCRAFMARLWERIRERFMERFWSVHRSDLFLQRKKFLCCNDLLKLNNFAKFERASKIVLLNFFLGRLKCYFHFLLLYVYKTINC